MPKYLYIPLIFLISLILQLSLIRYLSLTLPRFNTIGFPTSFEQAQSIAELFQEYYHSHFYTLLIFQVYSFLFLQTWCIPGTFIFNLLGGAVFGMKLGFTICLLCNVLGAYFCFSLSKFFAKELIDKYLSKHRDQLKLKIQANKQDLFLYLLSLRVFPGTPNWAMNITFPHLKIPDLYVIFSIMIGLIPWNFIVCEAGMIISSFSSKDQVIQPSTYIGLIVLALSIAIFNFFRNKQKK